MGLAHYLPWTNWVARTPSIEIPHALVTVISFGGRGLLGWIQAGFEQELYVINFCGNYSTYAPSQSGEMNTPLSEDFRSWY